MYVKLTDGRPTKFPFNLGELRKAHPNTSFPNPIPDSTLAGFDVYPVVPVATPAFDNKTHRASTWVSEVDSAWTQTWDVQRLPEDLAATNVRSERNRLLAASDWTQLVDAPLNSDAKLAWQLYRETLRLVPQQAGFPWDVQWPPEPGNS